MPISIRPATLGDAGAIMAFVRDHWSPNHVLAHHKGLLDWQHRAESDCRYNVVLALDEAGQLHGMLGFIPISRYDPALRAEHDTVWLTMWKVRENSASGLGIALLRAVSRVHPSAWIGTVGLNAATKGIYDVWGYETGRFDRFVLLNEQLDVFRLAIVPANFRGGMRLSSTTRLSPASRAELLGLDMQMPLDTPPVRPRKTGAYLVRRYLDHPYYDYRLYSLSHGEDRGIIATRLCCHDGARALRVVDFVGTPRVLSGAGQAFRSLVSQHDAEYLDFYCTGASDELVSAGLRNACECEGLILPSHFEPFERRNAELLYAVKGSPGRTILSKGDADQDRPNHLPPE